MGDEGPPPEGEAAPSKVLTAKTISDSLSLLEEVERNRDEGSGRGYAFTKCDLAATQCEIEAATDIFDDYDHVRYLSLATCKMASCKPLSPLTRLRWLDLSTAALAEPGSLPPLPALQILKLPGCGIASFAGCTWEFPQLRALDLSGNALTEVPEFGQLPSLTFLSLAKNQIAALPVGAWAGLPALATLQAEGNAPLADLAGLATTPALASLTLSDCPEISSAALLKPLADVALSSLTVTGTPLAETPVEVLLVLPKLQLLNGAPPTEEDVAAAADLKVEREREAAEAAAAAAAAAAEGEGEAAAAEE